VPHSTDRILLFTVNPPTSVEAQRAFSDAGILCTKIRSHLEMRHYILCVFCAAIIATRGLDLHSYTPYVYCTCRLSRLGYRDCITVNLSINILNVGLECWSCWSWTHFGTMNVEHKTEKTVIVFV